MLEKSTPLRLFVVLLAVLFCVEGATMFALDRLLPHDFPLWATALIDATILTTIASVFVWWMFVQPLRVALAGELKQAKVVMDTAVEGILSFTRRGDITSINRAAERMFGYPAQDILGASIKQLLPEMIVDESDVPHGFGAALDDVLASGRAREFVGRRRDGSVFAVELNLVETQLAGVRRVTGIMRDIAERKEAEAHIAHLAYYDNLTDLPSRALFYDRLKQSITNARRDQHELSLLYIDLDRFKAVNDTLGHDAGDELLKMVAARLQGCVRESDTVARLGGDEFVVILPEIDCQESAKAVADKIIDSISSKSC